MKLGLIGKNISYSLSPLIFKTLSNHLNIDISYEIFDIDEIFIRNVIQKLQNGNLHGVNVTKPYKEIIMKYCDILSEEAKEVMSVNTLKYENGLIKGYNTDIYGFNKLLEETGLENTHPIYVFGNGGSAKSVAHVLKQKNLDFIVVKRNDSIRNTLHNLEITYDQIDSKPGLIIQTTTVGLNQLDRALIKHDRLFNKSIIDLIYHVPETVHMKYAKHKFNGLNMLVHQALKSFSIWSKFEILDDERLVNQIKDVLNHELYR